MTAVTTSFVDAAKALSSQIEAVADEIEQSRRLPPALVEAIARAGLFRLWIARALGGEEADPTTLVRVVEEVAHLDGSVGWCVAIGGSLGLLSGYLPTAAAREVYGRDPLVVTAGAFRPFGDAVVVDGGFRVTGRWPLGSGCGHSHWIVGGCRILDADQPRLAPDGSPITRILIFSAGDCEILDTWHSIGLRGTGSHHFAVSDLFVPAEHSLSFREPPSEPGPLYAMPTIAVTAPVLAAVPLGITRHAIEIVRELARTKIVARSRRGLSEDAMMQANLGTAEAIVRSARGFLFQSLNEAWQTVCANQTLSLTQRAMLWLASTHAATAAKQAAELMFVAAGSAAPYASGGIERCVRDIHAACQHVTLAPPNYQMAGQAFLDLDMRATPLLFLDDRGT